MDWKPKLPSTAQLAQIASGLPIVYSTEERAATALAIWDACANAIAREKKNRAFVADQIAKAKAREALLPKVPRPKRFPATLDEFLRLVIGGRRYADRMKKFRDFLVSGGLADVPRGADPGQVLKSMRKNGFQEEPWESVGLAFLRWREHHDQEVRTTRARNAAKRRHGRRKKKVFGAAQSDQK